MIERLITSLEVLAAPADVQLHRLAAMGEGEGRPVVSEAAAASAGPPAALRDLAFEFADAHLLVSDCPQVLLGSGQQLSLDALAGRLEDMLRDGGSYLWQPAGLRESAEWENVRRLAAESLRLLTSG